MPNPIENWDKEQIKKLAQISGKPLEVQCSEAFLKAAWHVRVGTYYTDTASEKIRELDFLATKETSFVALNSNRDSITWHLRFRILGSCKGFAPEYGPVTYSVSIDNRFIEKARFICYECGIHGRKTVDSLSEISARFFLQSSALASTRQVVGFDIFQCKEDHKKPFEYLRKTDRDLYEGLDSAIKAAAFWQLEDRREKSRRTGQDHHAYIALNVPLLIFSQPFWDVAIDQGKPAEPELKYHGFHVGLYPSGDIERSPEPTMSVLWEASKLEELTHQFHKLWEEFISEAEEAVKKI